MDAIITAVVIPALFIIINVLIEMLLAVSPDFSKPGAVKVTYADGTNEVEHITVSPAKMICIRSEHPSIATVKSVVNVGTFHWWDYPSIALNLYLAALSVGSLALFSENIGSLIKAYKALYTGHLLLFGVVIILSVMQRNASDEVKAKQFGTWSLALSFVTAVTTLWLLRGA